MSGQPSKTLWSPWAVVGSLLALVWALTSFSVLAAPQRERGGPVSVAIYLTSGIGAVVVAVRAARLRTRVRAGRVVHFGMWRREELTVSHARPEVIDGRLWFYVWAPVVETTTKRQRVLRGLAGYSLSRERANRRVAEACRILNGGSHRGDDGPPQAGSGRRAS